jgi:hypothetical protein
VRPIRGREESMERRSRWKVVLDAEAAPAVGAWVAISGMGPGQEEAAHFLFLDGTEAEGFTFLEAGSSPWDRGPSIQELMDARANGTALWIRCQDCVKIVGVERLAWRPEAWPHDRPLWLLTVESLPSNAEFEMRLFAEHEKRKAEARRGLGRRLRAFVARLAAPQVR